MGYSVETTEDNMGFVEVLTVKGKEYKKRWKYISCGRYECQDEEFCNQLQEDGLEDEELLEIIQDQVDRCSLSFGLDLLCISRLL